MKKIWTTDCRLRTEEKGDKHVVEAKKAGPKLRRLFSFTSLLLEDKNQIELENSNCLLPIAILAEVFSVSVNPFLLLLFRFFPNL